MSAGVEPGPVSREQRREEMSERIVETALRVLGEEGYEAVTIQRLASELGFAVGALYRYFKSKNALLVAVLHRIMGGLGKDLLAADLRVRQLEGLGDVDRALLRAMVAGEVYVRSSWHYPREFGLVSTLIGDPRELLATEDAAPLLSPMVRMIGELTRIFTHAQDVGALEPASASARAVTYWASLQGILQLRKLGRFGVEALASNEHPSLLISGLLIGWGGDPERVRVLAASKLGRAPEPDDDPSPNDQAAPGSTPP